jgi:hypothetical protein
MATDLRSQLQSEFDVTSTAVTGQEFRAFARQWVESFCPNVKRRTGRWVYNGYRWHAYSFHFEQAISGVHALEAYQSKPIVPFLVFHESNDQMLSCRCQLWPDLRGLNDDIYVFPCTMEWTFVTTHEMSSGLGPYFALRSKATSAKG